MTDNMRHDEPSILLIHGDLPERAELTSFLTGRFADVRCAASADEALAASSERHPDAVVICHSYGFFDGFDAASRLFDSSRLIPTIMVGPDPSKDDLSRAMDLGCSGWCETPFGERLGELLDKAAALKNRIRSYCEMAHTCDMMPDIASETRTALLYASPGGRLSFINRFAGTLFNRDFSGEMNCSMLLLVPRLFSGRRGQTLSSLLQAIEGHHAWQGDLYGTGQASERVFSIELIQRGTRGTGGSLILARESTARNSLLDQMILDRDRALDLLRLAQNSALALKHASASVDMLCGTPLSPAQKEQARTADTFITATRLALSGIFRFAGENPEQAAPEPFLLRSTLESAASDICDRSPLQLALDIDRCIPDSLSGVPHLIRYYVEALHAHAVSLGGAGSSLSLRLRERSPSGVTLSLAFAVNDPKNNENSFDSAPDYVRRLEASSGLRAVGISLAATIAETMGGTLAIRCIAGEKRIFSCDIRLCEAPAETAEYSGRDSRAKPESNIWADGSSAYRGKRLRVLVADDNAVDQAALSRLITRAGHEAVTVSNGREAVDEYENGGFDIVLMDILMPVMDGFEATALIRQAERLTASRAPVIALTSYALKAVRDKCVSVGMDGYMAKPVSQGDIQALFARIQNNPARENDGPAPRPSAPDRLPVLDLVDTIRNLDGDIDFYRELVSLYQLHAPPTLESLLSALENGQISQVQHLAHKLKGMTANLGAARLTETLRMLEEQARTGAFDNPGEHKNIVSESYDELVRTFTETDWEALSDYFRPE